MIKIMVKDGNIDNALRRLKVSVAKSGVPSKLKERKYYEKPGVKTRRQKEEMTRNARKKNKRNKNN